MAMPFVFKFGMVPTAWLALKKCQSALLDYVEDGGKYRKFDYNIGNDQSSQQIQGKHEIESGCNKMSAWLSWLKHKQRKQNVVYVLYRISNSTVATYSSSSKRAVVETITKQRNKK